MKTPLYYLLTTSANNQIFVKRDDLLPTLLGGNKARIAKEYMRDMYAKNCNCMVGYGNARSNLCRALALACRAVNCPCHIISPADDDGHRISTLNYCITKKTGAVFHECSKINVSDTVADVMDELRNQGMHPYYIYGNIYGKGNEAVPVNAYMAVYDEIVEQSKELNISFDYIFLATGVGMTQAGLLSGRAFRKGKEKVIGISIAREAAKASEVIATYCNSYSLAYNMPSVCMEDIYVSDEYVGEGYGKAGNAVKGCIDHMLVHYSLPLDETYTGKAFWGMSQYFEQHPVREKKVLFIHTGGTPLFYDNINS